MTSLALAMQDSGWTVSGSDTDEVFITDDVLKAHQIPIQSFSDPIPAVDKIIYSAAYDPNIIHNTKYKILPITLAEALADFVKDRFVIAVAGVGGKTTTSAMLATLFHSVSRDVGYYAGTNSIAGLSAPGHCGSDPIYIVEADEYAISKTDPRPKFELLNPQIVITTNIVHDHPDIYPTINDTLAAFRSLVEKIPPSGTWIYNSDDPLTQELLGGSTPKCKLLPYNSSMPPLSLSVFGAQNELDAQAAVLASVAAGLTAIQATVAIQAYRGAGRRQEFHGEIAGRLLYDDYGHHPAEIKITIEAFKHRFPDKRLFLVFESHTYSRTEALLSDFATAIKMADISFIMPIFESAREKGRAHSLTTESFATLSNATPLTWDNATTRIWSETHAGDIILTMGAGFVYKLHDQFKKYAYTK